MLDCWCREGEASRVHLISCSENYLLTHAVDGYNPDSSAGEMNALRGSFKYTQDPKQVPALLWVLERMHGAPELHAARNACPFCRHHGHGSCWRFVSS